MGTRRDLAWSLIEDATSVLAVVAHPDDESFGLGAILSWFTQRDVPTAVLCFTRGEQSTLRSDTEPLDDTRSTEFIAAARALNVGHTIQLDHPDGALATVAVPKLTASIHQLATEVDADLLLVFDQGGITGHPDHGLVPFRNLAEVLEPMQLVDDLAGSLALVRQFETHVLEVDADRVNRGWFDRTIDESLQKRPRVAWRHVLQIPDIFSHKQSRVLCFREQ